MRARLVKTDQGMSLSIPQELADACGLGEDVDLTVEGRTLCVAAPDWRSRQGWKEAVAAQGSAPETEAEDEETLAYWANLPEVPPAAEAKPDDKAELALHEAPPPYGKRADQQRA